MKRLDADRYEEHKQRRLQHKSVCLSSSPVPLTHNHHPFHLEATRYTNPLKQKFRAKRLATESVHSTSLFLLYSSIAYGSLKPSRWSCCRCPQTSRCPDAGRVSASQQDPIFTESARERQQGSAHGPLLTVSIVFTTAFGTR